VPVDNNDQSTNDQPTASTSQQGEGNAAVCALTLTKMKGKQWMPVTLADKVTKAEILMASKLVTSNYSFSSYAEMGEICKLAFSDSEIAQHLTIGKTKVAYVLVYGLAPYFRAILLDDCRASKSFFTIYFDETTTRQIKKQLDIHIAFWSNIWNKVVTIFFRF